MYNANPVQVNDKYAALGNLGANSQPQGSFQPSPMGGMNNNMGMGNGQQQNNFGGGFQ
jgi:hypothetical protein